MKSRSRVLVGSPAMIVLRLATLWAGCLSACGPLPGEPEVGMTASALVQSSDASPAVGQNGSDGRLLFAYTVDNNGQRDIFGRLMLADGTPVSNAFVISNSPLDEFGPSVTGGNGKFLVSFTRSFGSTDSDPETVLVDSASGAVGPELGLDTSFDTLHRDARCVIVSAASFHCVYRSDSELLGLDLASNGVVTNRQTIAARPIIRKPSLTFSPPAGRFLVAWNSSFTEDIELAVRSSGSNAWQFPSTASWPRQVCGTANCINSGDNVSVTWNPVTRKFAVAIVNDLNSGGWVEGLILPDTCSTTACALTRSRVCASASGCTETFHLAEKASLGDVAIAPAGRNFVIAYVHDDTNAVTESSLSIVGMDETGLRLQTTPLAVQPSPVRNPLVMNGSFVGAGLQAVLAHRVTFDSLTTTPVKMAVITNQGSVTGVWGVAQ